jgi:nucleotide-binding universal stress UspA family protein
LRVIHVVVTPSSVLGRKTTEREEMLTELQAGERMIKSALDTIHDCGLAGEAVVVESGTRSVAQVVLDESRQWPADILVLGVHPLSTEARVGHTTREVLAGASVPVLCVRAEECVEQPQRSAAAQ